MKKIQQILLIILLFTTQLTLTKSDVSFEKELSIKVLNHSSIFIDTGSGALNIKGTNGDKVIVNAFIHSDDYKNLEALQQAFDEKMEFSIASKSSKIVLKALKKKSLFTFSRHNILMDLTVFVPRDLKVEIDDGSGSMTIANINNSLEIDDGSGSITIDNIVGNVFIDDGSGNSSLSHIDGNVTIDDGSGTINIDHVSGDVSIDDGSGAIIINNLQGKFNLEDDGSGSIRVNGKRWNKD